MYTFNGKTHEYILADKTYFVDFMLKLQPVSLGIKT